MKRNGARVAALSMWMTLAACSSRDPDAAHTSLPPIIPAPLEFTTAAGSFVVNADTRIVATGDAEPIGRYFVDLTQRTLGLALAPGENAAGSIVFALGDAPLPEEGYALSVTPDGITVSAHDTRGLLYGAVTLWQLLTSASREGATYRIAALRINDAPRFRWRGLMLDSARHYQSPSFIKQFIDWMALHKLNVLHWHLTDDQAWRLEIKKYPLLTRVGAWRVPAGQAAAADRDPVTGETRLHGGFYSQDEVRDIVAYARSRAITIVPEIEMPGHASAAVVAYPKLGVSRTLPTAVPSDWGVYTTLFNADETTFTFLEEVLAEVVAMFPGEYVHVGGDEAVKDEWQASPAIQARMRALGLKDEHALQGYFIQRMGKFLNARGRKLIGWDEILEGGLAPNASVMSWRGIDGAVAAAQAGHDTVLSPAPQLYLDHWQNDGDPAPGRSDTLSLEQVYKFDPMPAALTPAQRKHILGVQANLWTEFMRTEQRIEYMTFPRAAALAEVAWSQAGRSDWAGFSARMPAQLARYQLLGIDYARTTLWPAGTQQRRTSHQLQMCGDGYLLSLEDDAPIVGSRAVFLVNISNPCWIWRGADLSKGGVLRATVGQIPFNFQIGKDAQGIPLPKPVGPDGELEVRIDGCGGAPLASMSLGLAVANYTVTTLPPAKLAPRAGKHDLCFTFTRARLDPMWAIDSVELTDH